ncbi:MAG TPA: hypothetical protein VEZ47_13000 [Gemmatirosa sp.]|jgi:hypothetical protein|nr:hypothetical protein [Gemmatirosa sp.]
MSRRPHHGLAALALIAAAPAALTAQSGSGDGFLFGAPRGALVLRVGFDQPVARGALFERLGRDLTLDRGSYGALNLGADVALRLAPQLDLTLGAGWARSSARSEYREFVEGDAGLPITQETRFTRVPLTGTLRVFLTPRGQALSRFAWVPARVAPYVGAGGGVVYYQLQQTGDFIVDPAALDIVTDTRRSSRWAPAGHALAGAEFALSPRLGLVAEARYTVARAAVDALLPATPARIDLSGLQGTVGLSIRF